MSEIADQDRYQAWFSQRNLYLRWASHPNDPSLDLAACVSVTGGVDWELLKRSMDAIGEAAPGVRTRFSMDGAQVVADPTHEPIRAIVVDDATPVATGLERLERAVAAGPVRPDGPMVEVILYPGDPGCVSLRVSHIAADGIGFMSVLDCVGKLYAAPTDQWEAILDQVRSHPGSSAPTPVLRGGKESYRRLLASVDSFAHQSLTAVPTNGRIIGLRASWHVDAQRADRLRDSAVAQQRGLPTLFFTAYTALLQRMSGTSEVVLGVPVANRGRQSMTAVGCYVNTLPLPIRLSRADTWAALAARVAAGSRLVVANQGLDLLGADHDVLGGRAFPGLDNAITFYPKTLTIHLTDAVVTPLPVARDALQYPLIVTVEDLGAGGFNVEMACADHLLEAEPRRIYEEALSALVDSPGSSVIGPSVYACDWAPTPVAGPPRPSPDVIDRVRGMARSHPARTALAGADSWTYERLSRRMDGVAAALDQMGAPPAVVMALPKSPEAVTAVLGIMASGRAYIPVDPTGPPERLRSILSQVAESTPGVPVAVVTGDGSVVAGLDGIALAGLDADPDAGPARQAYDPSSVAYVIFTSGTTGQPKGVMIERHSIADLVDGADAVYHFSDDDPQTWCLFHSLAFDFSVWEIFGALTHGHTLLVPTAEEVADPEATARLLRDQRVSVLNQTPSAFRRLRETLRSVGADDPLPDLRWVVFGGEALYPADVAAWLEAGLPPARFVNMFGITETTVHVTHRLIGEADLARPRRSAIGQPLDHWGAVVVDCFGCPAPPGVPGELLVTGAGLARGYLGRPDLTAQRFRWLDSGRAYRSGDAVAATADGLVYHGRIDQQVQLRGHRIELGEVAVGLQSTGLVSAAAVRLVAPAGAEPFLAAWVVPSGDQSLDDIRQRAADWLPPYMVPARIVEVGQIPTTVNGKPDFDALSLPTGGPATDEPAEPADLAGQIAAIWESVIGAGHVSPNDRFMEVGGTSMHVMQIHDILSQRYGAGWLTLIDLFGHPTPAALAELIESHCEQEKDS